MSFAAWMTLIGALLLALALSSAWLRRMPVSNAALYLGVGLLLGPWGLDVLRVNLAQPSIWLEHLVELALVLSLFIGGLRLRLSPLDRRWFPAYRLAGPLMVTTIGVTAVISALLFGLPWGIALLVAAALAPTDPVLAGAVTVGHADDRDHLRYALSGEAGLNDGAAFPFVILALALIGSPTFETALVPWFFERIVWAIPAGLALGYGLGRLVGALAIRIRSRSRDTAAPTDFLALAVIALTYVAAEAIGAWGFLAVFAAGLGLRAAELSTVSSEPHPEVDEEQHGVHPPAETLVTPNTVTPQEMEKPAVAAGVLVAEVFSFGDTMERLLEVLLVVLVGASLAYHWDLRGVLIGVILIVLVRMPLTWLCLAGSSLTRIQRALAGWFGIRGIGSLFYVAYAAAHGLSRSEATEVAGLVLSAVATSIVIHGASSQVLMEWYERRKKDPSVTS